MSRQITHPKLRWPLDIRVHNGGDGQNALVLQCPIGIAREPLVLVPEVAPILALFEGVLSFDEILSKFSTQGLQPQILTQLIELLDDNLFLATPRFFAAVQETKEAFRSSPVRRATRAGYVYPSTPSELGKMVDDYLDKAPPSTVPAGRLLCLVSPHIDYRRGGAAYGKIYPRLAGASPDVMLLIGTAHQYSAGLFHLCAKDFECPLGTLRCDVEFVSSLANAYGIERSFADEYLHKQEHSLELQLPFLVRAGVTSRIVPILVGSFHKMLSHDRAPEEWPEYDDFVSALAEALKKYEVPGRSACIIAGVDMAHVGRAFGDGGALTQEAMREIAIRDHEYLVAIQKGDKKSLFRHMMEDHDARRICGFPTMYTIMDLFDRLGKRFSCDIVKYDQAVDYHSDCAVTFASLAMYEEAQSLASSIF